jgi:hypothetical protein
MREILVGLLIGTVILGLGYSLGKGAGYERALADVKLLTPPPKTTDQQCVAWLFDSNMRDVKKRICK